MLTLQFLCFLKRVVRELKIIANCNIAKLIANILNLSMSQGPNSNQYQPHDLASRIYLGLYNSYKKQRGLRNVKLSESWVNNWPNYSTILKHKHIYDL